MSVNKASFPGTVWDGRSESRNSRLIDRHSENEDHDQIVAELIAVEDYLLNALSSVAPYEAETDSGTVLGSPVYMTNAGHVDLAQANHPLTAAVVGFAAGTFSPMTSAQFIAEGKLSKADWTPVIGVASLQTGKVYFLDPDNPGRMTAVAPTAVGEFVVRLGRAVSTTVFDIEISQPIRL